MDKSQIDAELLALFFDGELSDENIAELNRVLENSESARQEFLDAVYLREGMRRWAFSRGSADALQVISLATSSVSLGPSEESPQQAASEKAQVEHAGQHGLVAATGEQSESLRSRDRSLPGGKLFVTAVALLLLVSASLYFGRPWVDGSLVATNLGWEADLTLSEETHALSESDSVIARLTSTSSDVRWSRGRVPSDFLMRFRPGDILGIESGIAQVEFSGGARLVLSSPAALQFTSGASARLMQGTVTGRAQNSNFALVTPTATVVDIGTEFGVGVGASGTDVTVFEGEVQVHGLSQKGDGGPVRRVREGMSMRIDANGSQASKAGSSGYVFRRDLLQPLEVEHGEHGISLLDLIGGHDYSQERIAGSIDPRSGYWGKPPWLANGENEALRGDTQFTATTWNRMVDGVFIPRSNAREMQIDSDGHVVHLPPNSGTSWGPIWARRLSDIDSDKDLVAASKHDQWGSGTLEIVRDRLLASREGVLGLHANVGITFDLDALREARGVELIEFRSVLLNLGHSLPIPRENKRSLADLRIFVDGKLKYSRLEFSADDGEANVVIPLGPRDTFITFVATDSDGDPSLDHVVLVDPILKTPQPEPMAYWSGTHGLLALSWESKLPRLDLFR